MTMETVRRRSGSSRPTLAHWAPSKPKVAWEGPKTRAQPSRPPHTVAVQRAARCQLGPELMAVSEDQNQWCPRPNFRRESSQAADSEFGGEGESLAGPTSSG